MEHRLARATPPSVTAWVRHRAPPPYPPTVPAPSVAAFLTRWKNPSGTERSNYQLFVADLCAILEVPVPDPSSDDTRDNTYVFERRVTFAHGDGSSSSGFIDCYRRGSFVLEAKKVRQGPQTKGFDDALLRARTQAENYARALPAAEGRPPFLVVVDVGNVIELYSEFSRSGGTYTPFPDPRSHRIKLADLADPAARERLRRVWLAPMDLDPTRASAAVTREVAGHLAAVARSLEAAGHAPEHVAAFLTRCLFSMFAEDVGLLPKGAFLELLEQHRDKPDTLRNMLRILWTDMDKGGFSAALASKVLRFNGKLFKNAEGDAYALPLSRDQIDSLLRAAKANWREVEPAIFGTLLERALDPHERHTLGAHYTPRAYVERLVMPTVVEPLREEWRNAQAAAVLLAREAEEFQGKPRDAKLKEARAEIERFHHRLCTVRVLDPACGSGNFLYVTLEHLKRLEGEVLNQLEALGAPGQGLQSKLGYEGETVTLQQLRGIEVNERAAALAELVLWIGYLQWQIRTRGNDAVSEPVIHDYGNIECRDAVLAYDREEPDVDLATGKVRTRWDGRTFKKHPVTGEDVPDATAQVVQMRYINPRKAQWPRANFVVGNPPFIGNKRMRDALPFGYVDTLRDAWPDVPESADFVMYWWHHAATLVLAGEVEQFGLITTNSLRQSFNRQVLEQQFNATPALSLRFAIPDHPWVDNVDGAAVRISMTVASRGAGVGRLLSVTDETAGAEGDVEVAFSETLGAIQADLNVGARVGGATALVANSGICFQGMNLVGKGFRLTAEDVRSLRYDPAKLPEVIQPHCNARDLVQGGDECFVIDLFGFTESQALAKHPALYQWLFDRVKPERDHNARASRRKNWWIFGEPVGKLRHAWLGLDRIILTPETSKHRIFVFRELPFCPDHKLYAICSTDAFLLGALSSTVHAAWAFRSGGRLGVGNDPTWTNTTTFQPFAFPDEDTGLSPRLRAKIRALAEQLDKHRKTQQAKHADLTLTGMYNVLEKLRAGETLSTKEKRIHEHGLVSVLRAIHDELDEAVLAAYGWGDLGPVPWSDESARSAWTENVLERLVALNAKRAAEEAAFERGEPGGKIRWLRPEFQDPAQRGAAAAKSRQTELVLDDEPISTKPTRRKGAATASKPKAAEKLNWPSTLPKQMRAVADALAASGAALDESTLASHFTGRGAWKTRLPQILATLEALGRARRVKNLWMGG